MPTARYLPGWGRAIGLLVLFPLGAIPSVLFFAWVERNATLPVISVQAGWPLIRLFHWPLAALAAWNISLLLLFGALHSGLAQPRANRLIESLVTAPLVRLFYVAVTGLSAWGVMALWQNTGIVLWSLPLGPETSALISLALYWGILSVAVRLLIRHGALEFVGLRQLYRPQASPPPRDPPSPLIRTGLYARVRHPLYTVTLSAFLVTPQMTLDRGLILVGLALYLTFGIPLEEKKLVARFGDAYRRYQREVPALVPFVFTQKRSRS